MMEPWQEEDARQAAWDRHCACSPACSICGEPLIQFDCYMQLDGEYYCEACVKAHLHSTDNLEDE